MTNGVSKIAETSTRHGFSFTTFPRPSVYSKKVIFTYFIKNSHRSRSVLSMKQIYQNQEVRAIFLGTGAHFINLICEIKQQKQIIKFNFDMILSQTGFLDFGSLFVTLILYYNLVWLKFVDELSNLALGFCYPGIKQRT